MAHYHGPTKTCHFHSHKQNPLLSLYLAPPPKVHSFQFLSSSTNPLAPPIISKPLNPLPPYTVAPMTQPIPTATTPMSEQPSSHPTPPLLPNLETPRPPPLLVKQKSWSPNTYKEAAWSKRKDKSRNRRRRSVTDDDLDELKACMELGFNFDAPDLDQRLSDTLPGYEFYYNVNKHYHEAVDQSPDQDSSELAMTSDSSAMDSPLISPGDDPTRVKTRLKQWAQVVACSVKRSGGA